MSRRRRKQLEAEDKSDIDLTPMLDVVFIMLIFFIVTASFVKEKTLGLNVPPDSEEQVQTANAENVLITVKSNNDIWMDDRRVDVRAVKSLIAQKKAENPKAAVIVRAHEESTADMYVAISDASREAKILNISLVPYK